MKDTTRRPEPRDQRLLEGLGICVGFVCVSPEQTHILNSHGFLIGVCARV